MDSIHGITSKLGGGFAAVGDVASATFKGFAAGGPIGAAIATGTEVINQAVDALKWCVGEAAQAEQAIKNLSIAVEKSGTSWDSVKEGTNAALSQMQKFTTYSDEQLAAALQQLLTFGMSYDDAMKALGTTVDLAAAKQMDLGSAANLLGKAFMGNTSILARYGIDIQTSKEASAAMKDAVDLLAQALGKASEDQLTSFGEHLADLREAVPDLNISMGSTKETVKGLTDALESGQINTDQFASLMESLGVNIDSTKLKGADFSAVMVELNEKFGGTAQEQAKTYAATQERLKNAVSDAGERIGSIFIPALNALAEGQIGVTDAFNRGFDAIGAWLGEVGKIPEIKAATDAVSGAFESLNQWFEDLGKTAMEMLGPALDEIWGAFKEIWDALQPAREAFDEICTAIGDIFAAISGGMGEGSFDAFKLILQAIVLPIRGIAEAIKLVVPVIKAFAEGFKIAADFIGPILEGIAAGIKSFINTIQTAFQGFYTWLVGGSLWMDMWNQLLSVAGSMVGMLLGKLGTDFFTPMQTAFTGALQTIETAWNTGWQNVQTTFTTISGQVGTALNTKLEEMKTAISTSTSEYAPIAMQALTGMQSAVNAGMDLVKGDWQGALGHIQDALSQWGSAAQAFMGTAMTNLQGAMQTGLGTMKGVWDGFVSATQSGIGLLQQAFANAQAGVQQTAQQFESATQPATTAVSNAFTGAFDTISTAATSFWDWLTGHSLWPDMLTQMTDTTGISLQVISDTFTAIFSNIQVFLHSVMQAMLLDVHTTFALMITDAQAALVTMLNIVARLQAALAEALASRAHMIQLAATAPAMAANTMATSVTSTAGSTAWPTAPAGLTGALLDAWKQAMIQMNPGLASVNLTNYIQIDGQTVAKTVEQRLISQRQIAGG
jgi:hypothetical protein